MSSFVVSNIALATITPERVAANANFVVWRFDNFLLENGFSINL